MLLRNILLLSQTNRGILGNIYVDENGVKYKGVNGGKIERIGSAKKELVDVVIDNEFEQRSKKFIIGGGSSGEVLIKNSNNDYDVKWGKQTAVGSSKVNSYMPSGW